MKNLKHIILAASVLFSTPIQATGPVFEYEDESIQCIDSRWSQWGDMTSKILCPVGLEELYLVRFVTSVKSLRRETWKEFKASFTSFYEEAWKDQDPKDMGIKGTFKQFLHQQFDRAFEDLRTNPNAVFLSITRLNLIDPKALLPNVSEDSAVIKVAAAISGKPVLGVFARKDEYQFKADDADHYRYADCLFLRLLVMRDASVMKQYPAIAKSLISETESTFGKRGIDAWLTVSRKGNPLSSIFEGLGFKSIEADTFEGGIASHATKDLLKYYPPEFYTLFLRDIEDDAVSSSEDESDDDAQGSEKLNASTGVDDDADPIVSKEDLRTSSDSTDPTQNAQSSEQQTGTGPQVGDIEDLGQQLSQVARPNTPAPATDEEIKTGLEEFHDVGDSQAALVGAFFANDDAEKIWHL